MWRGHGGPRGPRSEQERRGGRTKVHAESKERGPNMSYNDLFCFTGLIFPLCAQGRRPGASSETEQRIIGYGPAFFIAGPVKLLSHRANPPTTA